MTQSNLKKSLLLLLAAFSLAWCGCASRDRVRAAYVPPPPVAPLGTLTDPLWIGQEARAEASDFVIYQHEFEYDGVKLNMAGEDHVKQIAYRIMELPDAPVIIERSMTSVREDSEYKYPVHPNPELDMKRRAVVAHSLALMGVPDADRRVLVAPALAEGYESGEAIQAYNRGYSNFGGFGGFGGGFGGFGGGFGGFGGGFGRF